MFPVILFIIFSQKKSPVCLEPGFLLSNIQDRLFDALTTQIIFVVTTEVDDLLWSDFQNTASQ